MKKVLFTLLCTVMIFGCKIDEQVNPNASSLESILNGATETDLNNLVTGVFASMRNNYSTYVTSTGIITRELYFFNASPPNTTDLIGTKGKLDQSLFYTTANWTSRYRTIKNCNIILDALDATAASVVDAEKKGYRGVTKTIIAHQFLVLWSAYFDSGIRLDVANPDKIGSLVTDQGQVLKFARDLLDEANTDLTGAEFAMIFTNGFVGFDTPATFSKFNRALAARAALYAGDKTAALSHLTNSFLDVSGSLSEGPKMTYSATGGDLLNGLFKVSGQDADQIFASDTWIAEAQTGDLRAKNKVKEKLDKPASRSGITVNYETNLYATSITPIDIIRNEELCLIYAEANIGTDNTKALAGINVVRSVAGLVNLTTTVTVDDVLIERRYSLWGEGHRMVDLRRTNNLNDTYITLDKISIDKDGVNTPVSQKIFTKFPVPLDEVGS